MCYEFGTLEQETAVCILCKLLNNDAPCPHQKGLRVCQDRQNHSQPIVFFTNAEYSIFNGCGYCKWAKRYPAQKEIDKTFNKGWPGCCRAPKLGEMDLIDDHDWPIVAKRYGLPDRSRLGDRPQRPVSLSKSASRSGSSARRGSIEIPKEEKEARNRNSSSPSRRGSPRIEQPSAKGSPRREAEEFAANGQAHRAPVRQGSNGAASQSITTTYIVAEERVPGMFHTRSMPRPAQPPPAPVEPQTIGRTSSVRRVPNGSTPSVSSGYPESVSSSAASEPRSLSDISRDFEGMSLTSTSSNRGSVTTVMSDSGFTDYLSDESEAELQRQAELRAAQLRRLRAEEAEFNAAKRGLANIDLQTPVAWNPTHPQPYNPSAYARR